MCCFKTVLVSNICDIFLCVITELCVCVTFFLLLFYCLWRVFSFHINYFAIFAVLSIRSPCALFIYSVCGIIVAWLYVVLSASAAADAVVIAVVVVDDDADNAAVAAAADDDDIIDDDDYDDDDLFILCFFFCLLVMVRVSLHLHSVVRSFLLLIYLFFCFYKMSFTWTRFIDWLPLQR